MGKESKDRGSPEQIMIRELAALLEETGLSEIEIEKSGLKVRVVRNTVVRSLVGAPVAAPQAMREPGLPQVPKAASPTGTDPASHPGCIKSPMVGTAYRAPEPGAAPFVEIGTRVSQGQTILIIEAMKTMNHIPAPKAGTVTQVFVENGQPVEFAEPLVIIE